MKISEIELYLVAIGQAGSSVPSHSLLVRISTSLGVDGWGESGLGWRVGEIAARREALLAMLEGRSIYDIEELHTMEALAPHPLRSAVEMAAWDALGRTLEQPLCNLLGGYYRRRVPVSLRLAGRHTSQAAQISRERAEQGFHTQTITATGRPDEDLRTLASIRDMLGDRIELRFDGMNQYSMDIARDLAASMEAYDVQFLLDPLNTPAMDAAASLSRQTSVPLAIGRAICSPADMLAAVRCNAAPFLLVDLEQVGGIGAARACAAIAAAAGVAPVLSSRPSVGIATAAMLHLAAATASFATGNELSPGLLNDTVLAEPLDISEGLITVPQGIGLGINVDRAKLERYQAN